MRSDVIVLGAGMVGVSAALHLQARGRSVVLVDRAGAAGMETSYGNAGLIERASYFPYAFPRDAGTVLATLLGRNPAARIVWSDLPATLPFIARYFAQSAPARAFANARATWPLIERSLDEHELLAQAAGAQDLLRRSGWLKAFRTQKTFDEACRDAEKIRPFGMRFDILDRARLQTLEPRVAGPIGAIHYRDPVPCIDPGGLVKAYADLFVARGGRFLAGDARTLARIGASWRVTTDEGVLDAEQALVAMGPWSDDVFRPLGLRIPLGVKRGYHMHYEPGSPAGANSVLGRPILDADNGYLLAPMRAGIRLTTGAEFARRDRPPSPVQLDRCEPVAREMVPLGKRVDAQPWLGRRPCLPDLLPVIGPAPGHAGLWFDFGHQHHGFTLGPATGRLIAEMMTGETPFTDPAPYRANRF